MKQQFDAVEWCFLVFAALSGSVIKLLRGKDNLKMKYVALEIIIGLSFCVFVVPFLTEYFSWSIRAACLATFSSAYTSHLILKAIENFVPITINIITRQLDKTNNPPEQ